MKNRTELVNTISSAIYSSKTHGSDNEDVREVVTLLVPFPIRGKLCSNIDMVIFQSIRSLLLYPPTRIM